MGKEKGWYKRQKGAGAEEGRIQKGERGGNLKWGGWVETSDTG